MKRSLVLTIALLILAACAPTPAATPLPTATALVAATALPTNTPTAIPTATAAASPIATPTATREPTFTVAGFSPDQYPPARLANAAITQYARAVNLKAEAITLQANQLKDPRGNSFTVAATIDGTPLLIWGQDQKSGEWGWKKPSLKDSGFPVGTLLDALVYNTNSTRQLYDEFNFASLDYDFQWFNTEPQKGNHVFTRRSGRPSDPETFTSFALEKRMTIYGGSLIYRAAYPDWLNSGSFSRDELIGFAKNHIKTTVEHFKGKIGIWTVVNEFHPASWGRKDVLRDVIGDGLIDIAFQTARESDSSAILIYNDDNNHAPGDDINGGHISNTMKIVNGLKAKNLIDGVGLEMHLDGSHPPSKQALIDTMKMYGLPIYITEMDVNIKDVQGTTDERNKIQARIYQDTTEACRESGVCRALNLYGIGDKFSWIERDKTYDFYSQLGDPTPFDDNLEPKAAYYAMLRALFNSGK